MNTDPLAHLRRDEEHAIDALLPAVLALRFVAGRICEHPEDLQRYLSALADTAANVATAQAAYDRARAIRQETAIDRADSGVDSFLPVSAAAAAYNISRQTLHSAIRAGKIQSTTRMERGKKTTYALKRDVEAYCGVR